METVEVQGVTYVRAKDIARKYGYTSDYIGQLCRAGKIHAQQVGRNWFVVEDSVAEHKDGRYRSVKEVSKRELRQVRERERRRENAVNKNFSSRMYPHGEIIYEADDSALLPETRKVSIVSHEDGGIESVPAVRDEIMNDKEWELDAEPIKKVVEVEEAVESVDEFEPAPEVMFKPMRGSLQIQTHDESELPQSVQHAAAVPVAVSSTFYEKLREQKVAEKVVEADSQNFENVSVPQFRLNDRSRHRFGTILSVVAVCIVILFIGMSGVVTWQSDFNDGETQTKYRVQTSVLYGAQNK